jgi:micrococcal nuclease
MIPIKNLVFLALSAILPAACAVLITPPEAVSIPPPEPASPRAAALPRPAPTLRAKVAYVIDGDTVVVTARVRQARVRLLGIDAPEHTRRRECFGGQATAGLRRLLPAGSAVRLAVQRRRDRYGRDLAFVWRADGMFVNLVLVRRGYATTLFLPPLDPDGDGHRAGLTAAENMARRERSGLWRTCRIPAASEVGDYHHPGNPGLGTD